MKFLVDNSIFHHAACYGSEWQPTRTVKWGNHEIETGRLVSARNHFGVNQKYGGDQASYLCALAYAHRNSIWEAHTTDALNFETQNAPIERYLGIGYAGLSVFQDVRSSLIEHITLENMMISYSHDDHGATEQFRKHLGSLNQKDYLEIRDALNRVKNKDKNSQDAWHLFCVETCAVDALLTCDFKLVGQVKSISDTTQRKRLLSRLMLPKDACDKLGLKPCDEDQISALKDLLNGGDRSFEPTAQ